MAVLTPQQEDVHGAYCLGCCWALMSVLLVVGLMNLVWMLRPDPGIPRREVLAPRLGPASSGRDRPCRGWGRRGDPPATAPAHFGCGR